MTKEHTVLTREEALSLVDWLAFSAGYKYAGAANKDLRETIYNSSKITASRTVNPNRPDYCYATIEDIIFECEVKFISREVSI